ncbi:protein psiQ-like isoform X2 [Leguminivora glycinivorella]|uniref:protein psiQ-like isoform X2 n=1 Tax=Leguminivora glycinivorella TaxID=1035111 RepID=UPI00200CDF15|nr:protein psiQ-like isoform X2 [Leguminivora glycinivorella]
MFRIVTFLTLLCLLRFARGNFRTCVPNTQFFLNERICYCDGKGQWTEASCHKLCKPGQTVWHGCSQCVCQDNGQLLCNNINCSEDQKTIPVTKAISSIGHWCTPLRIYYVDCNVCVCPESGKTANVHCVKDNSCTALRTPSISDLLASNKNTCKPSVLYVFHCLQCLCSEEGIFTLNNCVETCPPNPKQSLTRTCTPHSFYRNECNVCLCPSDGIHSDSSCTQEVCDDTFKFKVLQALTSESKTCIPHQFTSPQCLYCHCNPDGTINQQTCLELKCLNTYFHEYSVRSTCTPGEMVPFCTECFCLRNGSTHHDYCTRGCSYRNKILTLEKIFKDTKNNQLLDFHAFDTKTNALTCEQNSIYVENDKFCLCPDSHTKEKSCLVAVKKTLILENPLTKFDFKESNINIDFSKPCMPSTFVEFDCNTCFCSKNGTIDPDWCTYDDCDAIRIIHEAQKAHGPVAKELPTCVPGSITEISCNFCICPDNGLSKDRACTKNRCSDVEPAATSTDNFDCDPLEYYEVDCNICLCPGDGIKNVAKCTKNICEDNFLRSDACVPGKLFSEECNICICPPDGMKSDRVCTKHDCKKADTTWKKIYQYSNSIIEELPDNGDVSEKKLDHCFPGEQFTIDGHFCVCPEMGFKMYATCSNSAREGDEINFRAKDSTETSTNSSMGIADSFPPTQITQKPEPVETCFVHNDMTLPANETVIKCTPGSMYVKGCQQCLCPVDGDKIEYCRHINTMQCNSTESSYMRSRGARTNTKNIAVSPHQHTRYKCARGTERDACHACECERDGMIREHCFSSAAAECAGVEPTFLRERI